MNLNITEKYTSSKNLSFYLNVGFLSEKFLIYFKNYPYLINSQDEGE